MGDRWIIDLTHYLMEDGSVFPPAERIANYFGAIAAAASAHPEGVWIEAAIRCRRRPERRPCPGHIRVRRAEFPGPVEWRCTSCDDNGLIANWRGTGWDFSPFGPETGDPILKVPVSWDELRELRRSLPLEFEGQAIVAGAVVSSGAVLLHGYADDFDDLVEFVAAEASQAENKARREILGTVAKRMLAIRREAIG